MNDIAIVVGSTRPGRKAEAVARWVLELAEKHAQTQQNARYQLVDIEHFRLPLLDEPLPPSRGQYTQPHTQAWAAKVASFDGYVFVTPEYNHGVPAALKNAIDFVYREWNNKAAGFVSYGSAGGVRAVEQLRTIMAEVQVATVRAQVMLSLYTDFEAFKTFTPGPQHQTTLTTMLDQLNAWAGALKPLRAK